MSLKNLGLGKAANKLVDRLDSFEKLKQVANKNNYPFKLKKLFERLTEEQDFWSRKGESPKLLDIQKDLNFITTQIGEERIDKVKVDSLLQKYPIN
jgi:hypothetical protein